MENKIISYAKTLAENNPGNNDWMLKRAQVVSDYCKAKGWGTNPADLSIEQIIEIRQTPAWIEAGKHD
jgi:hypothetical protein